jgi:hypothetical protein
MAEFFVILLCMLKIGVIAAFLILTEDLGRLEVYLLCRLGSKMV